jgi:colanic acid/amylovoran biosynthesis glycosyltransferase
MSLAILPSLTASRGASGRIRLTKKFIDGMRLCAEYWPGSVMGYLEESDKQTRHLDEVDVTPSDLPFGCELVSYSDPKFGEALAKYDVVMGSVSYKQIHLSALCHSIGVPFLFVSEYSLKTQLNNIYANTKNPVLRLRRMLWSVSQERRTRQAIRSASGVQCNGTPTCEDYSGVNRRRLLFFDTRVAESMLPTVEEVRERTDSLLKGAPLRLIFSGRLIPPKGADHLVLVADALRNLGVCFHLTICGDGVLTESICADLSRRGLADCVTYAGVLDFKSELVPLIKHKMDLFLCCHLTGDPSCTYLETMSCGVPIIGYANEAFQGLIRRSGAGRCRLTSLSA